MVDDAARPRERPASQLRGDEERLFREFNPALQSLVAVRVRASHAVVEDACAFAWMQFIRRQPDRSAPWKSWLVTTAVREGWRMARDETATPFVTDLAQPGHAFTPSLMPKAPESRHAEAVEALKVLGRLSPPARRVKAMQVGGYSYDEIATELGITYSDVNHRVQKANRELEQAQQLRPPSGSRAARLAALEADPPRWLVKVIGRPITSPRRAEAGLAWRRAALALDDYVQVSGGQPPGEVLAHRPADAAMARRFDYAAAQVERLDALRARHRSAALER